jgi:hypothetical protein
MADFERGPTPAAGVKAGKKVRHASPAAPKADNEGTGRSVVRRTTVEDRLKSKARIADSTDFSQEKSLGRLSREERRKALFGE